MDDAAVALRRMVRYSGVRTHGDGEHVAVDLLERAIERYRIQHRVLENQVSFEDFIQCRVGADPEGRLEVQGPKEYYAVGSGTPSISLQPTLLAHLLLSYQVPKPVLEQITSFVDRVWDQLGVLDFKRTRTGVVRCFTNTRTAANTLRDYGLLRYTKREARKTWRLSAAGVVVAARVFKDCGWALQHEDGHMRTDANRAIARALHGVGNPQTVLHSLMDICDERAEHFRRFESLAILLAEALERFERVLIDEKLKNTERHERCSELVNKIEESPEFEGFENQLSMSLRTDFIEDPDDWSGL